MRVHELLNPTKPRVLLEGRNLAVFEALSPLLRISEQGDGGEPGRYYPIFRPGGGMSPNFWFNELHRSLKNLAVASNVKKRLKELGVQERRSEAGEQLREARRQGGEVPVQ